MDIKLPLSTKHSLLCYGDNAFNDAIASSQEYISEALAVISDVSFNEVNIDMLTPTIEYDNLTIEITNQSICAHADLFKNQLRAAIIFGSDDKINLCFKVSKHVPLSSWSYIAAFVVQGQNDNILRNISNLHIFGKYSKRGFFYNYQDCCRLLYNKSEMDLSSYYIKITSQDNTIIFLLSYDSLRWMELYKIENIDVHNCTCGIIMDFVEAEYYNWLYSRHLQIYCERNIIGSTKPIDYFYLDSFDCIERHNPHVKKFCIPQRLIPKDTEGNLRSFICKAVKNNQYVDLNLNEYYVGCRSAYKRYNYFHYNMIYGIDDEEKMYYVLGYNQDSKLSASKISLCEVYKAFVNSNNFDAILRQFNTNDFMEKLNCRLIISDISDYLNGIDSAKNYPDICKERSSCCFGIKIYDVLLESSDNLRYMSQDLRIPYFILEHKKLIKSRTEFLNLRQIIDDGAAEVLMKLCDQLINDASIVLLLSIKIRMKRSENGELEDLAFRLKQLRKIEINLLKQLYSELIKAVNHHDKRTHY